MIPKKTYSIVHLININKVFIIFPWLVVLIVAIDTLINPVALHIIL